MFSFKRSLISTAIAVAMTQGVAVQAALVKGIIQDGKGTLPGAKVEVIGQKITTQSDNEGQFILRGVEAGNYQIKVSYLGYEDVLLDVSVKDDGINQMGKVLLNTHNETLEELVVLGDIVHGEMQSLNVKKNANRIVDVLSADGIGKLPDRNAAEAVQRIAGVSIERDQGEGRFVAVRGLPSQWSSSSINGNRLPTAEEETTSRATAFDFFPSEMIASVEVNKAVTADMEGDAIGGNVNFITKMPPQDLTLNLGFSVNYNEKANGYGNSWNVLFGDRTDNEKFAYLVNLTGWTREWATDNYEPRRGSDDQGIKRLELRDYTGERETYGFNGAMEYNLDNGDEIYARGLYGTLSDTETHYKHRYRFDKDRVELQHIYDELITQMWGVDIGGKHTIGSKSQLDWGLSTYENSFKYGDIPNGSDNAYFVARFDQTAVRYEGLENRDGSDYAYNTIDGGSDPADAISNHLPSDFSHNPSTMPLQYIELYKVKVTEKDNIVANLDFSHEFTAETQLKFGGKYRDKERIARFSDEFYIWDESKGGPTPVLGDFALKDQPGRDEFLDELDINYSEDFSQVADVKTMQAFWNANKENFILDEDESALISNGGSLGINFDVFEDQFSLYGMVDHQINQDLSMNLGIRLEYTDTEVKGMIYDADSNTVTPNTESTSYLSVLPSFHLKYALDDLQNLRLALTRTFARPDFGAINPGGTYLEIESKFYSGNTELDPTYSNNIDLMWEKYFGTVGIVSAGLFYKDIQDPIFQNSTNGGYKGEDVTFYRPENGDSAWLAGMEVSLDRRFDFISSFMTDFGMRINYTYMDSGMTIPGRDDEVAIPRQADQLANIQLYYDNSVLAARIAANHKGAYIEEHGISKDTDSYYGDYTSVDFSAQVQLGYNWLIYFEANNLTNEPIKYYLGDEDRPEQVEYYGSRFQLGVNYKVF